MKKIAKLFAVLLALMSLSGCLIYSDVQYPLDSDFTNTELGEKQGSSSSYSILFLVSWGDSGAKAAAENGHIETIKHADQRFRTFLWPIYQRWTTVVYGD